MRTYLYILFNLCLASLSNKVSAQGESSFWYFGNRAGLSFHTSPPTPLSNCEMYTAEGSSVANAKDGRLLFYSNGDVIYNRNHTTMPNGSNLAVNATSAQGVLIVPKPADSNIYYVFTADGAEGGFRLGYRYSIVDMQLNGGLGDVTSQKNVLLYARSTERLTAVKHANGIDYWIVTKELETNRFLVYRLTCNGIETNPVVSSVGSIHSFDPASTSGIGIMKISPDGKKLAITIRYPIYHTELFDFDVATGQVSNSIVLPLALPEGETVYGVEFSPNSQLLYISIPVAKYIFQYDISSNNQTLINASRYTIDLNQEVFLPFSMQSASDGKIYVVDGYQGHMSIINNPDISGGGCNFTAAALSLGGRLNAAGLPNFTASSLDSRPTCDFNINSDGCNLIFTGTSRFTGNIVWKWDFGDGKSDTGKIVRHSYRRAGNYKVSLKFILTSICGPADSFTIVKPVSVFNVFAVDFNNTGNCVNNNTYFFDSTLLTNGKITGWSWDFADGSTSNLQNPIHNYASPGEYNVKLVVSTSGICRADSIFKKVFIDTKPRVNFNFSNGCVNQAVLFTDASSNQVGVPVKWVWNWGDGNSDSSYRTATHSYLRGNTYSVQLTTYTEHGCFNDTIRPVVIEDIPAADFIYQGICFGENTFFTDQSTVSYGKITNWTWDFGNNSRSTAQNPIHVYAMDGGFRVVLTVQTQYGCKSNPALADITIRKITANAGRDSFAVYDQPFQLQGSGGDFYQWAPVNGLNNPSISNPVARIKADMSYILKVTSTEGCSDTDTINLKVFTKFDIYVPNAFTPNGDGRNDLLTPICIGIKALNFFGIYNRWGQLVFSTNEMGKGWDGRVNGVAQLVGNYIWVVSGVDILGRDIKRKGNVLLIK